MDTCISDPRLGESSSLRWVSANICSVPVERIVDTLKFLMEHVQQINMDSIESKNLTKIKGIENVQSFFKIFFSV